MSVWDYSSPESLARHLLTLNADDQAYDRLVRHKTHDLVDNDRLVKAMRSRTWSAHVSMDEDLSAENFVEAFECYVCVEASRKLADENRGFSTVRRAWADSRHFNCPSPVDPVTRRENPDNWWAGHWRHAGVEAQAVHQLLLVNRNYTADEFHDQVVRLLLSDDVA